MIHDDDGDVTVVVLKCTEFQRQTRPFARSDIQLHRLYEVFHLFTSSHPENSP
jgi:hypothetical protein